MREFDLGKNYHTNVKAFHAFSASHLAAIEIKYLDGQTSLRGAWCDERTAPPRKLNHRIVESAQRRHGEVRIVELLRPA